MALITVATLKAVLGTGSLYADADLQSAIDTADALIASLVDADAYTAAPAPMKEACLVLATDVWQNRTAAGGQPVAVDFTPSPYRMGRTLTQRITGLIAPYMTVGSMVG